MKTSIKNFLNILRYSLSTFICICLIIYMLPTIPFGILRKLLINEYKDLKYYNFFKFKEIKMLFNSIKSSDAIKITKTEEVHNLCTDEKITYEKEKIIG